MGTRLLIKGLCKKKKWGDLGTLKSRVLYDTFYVWYLEPYWIIGNSKQNITNSKVSMGMGKTSKILKDDKFKRNILE